MNKIDKDINYFKSIGLMPIGILIVNGYLLVSFVLYVAITLILHINLKINFARYNDIVIFTHYSIIIFIVYKYHLKNFEIINIRKLNLRKYILLSCGLVFAYYFLKFSIQILSGKYLILEIPHLFEETNPFLFSLHCILAVTLGPFLEELIFRGFMYPPLRKKFNAFRAIVISATIFSIWHIGAGVKGHINLFLMGILLAYLYDRSKSLLPSIIAHSLINLTWIITILYKYYFENAHYRLEKKYFVMGMASIYFMLSFIFYFFIRRIKK